MMTGFHKKRRFQLFLLLPRGISLRARLRARARGAFIKPRRCALTHCSLSLRRAHLSLGIYNNLDRLCSRAQKLKMALLSRRAGGFRHKTQARGGLHASLSYKNCSLLAASLIAPEKWYALISTQSSAWHGWKQHLYNLGKENMCSTCALHARCCLLKAALDMAAWRKPCSTTLLSISSLSLSLSRRSHGTQTRITRNM